MKNKQVKLSKYNNDWYTAGSTSKKLIWYFVNIFIFKAMIPLSSSLKVKILKIFGSKIGTGVVIKPNVSIKYPWFLSIGDNCWIGEDVWIDNLAQVTIGDNVCLSQGSYLLTGSHNYKEESFDLIIGPIILEDGVWIGAKAIVCPGIICKTHSILSVGSIATKNLEANVIYQGNPAIWKRERRIDE
ncbi:WcaF family extracellular polysaccharide biosynthesis acetyltransferase [Poseidonibacter lekithochrous]|uniref:WcaF family extracellular polysaccharide biosynthesis acetyltransferase n=1 Tax=Poseidonibacter lekithochrous TaxID=1904463 RepID=UPI000D37D5B3|nr:WcaF family extracellular polysaccharide biosynthesis acetyltransferase [Poseidonibacter lekithochrous]